MTPALSLFLDLTRILAAAAVFVTHVSWHTTSGGLLWQFYGLGREAVDVFFVLSGFVIAHVTMTRETSGRDYAISRLARVYSVALPALVATFLLDAIGRGAMPMLYHGYCCDIAGPVVWQFLRNLLFVGDVWSLHVTPGSNIPWWSLGYEVWYYVAFGLILFLRRPWNYVTAVVVLAAAGPGIAVLFPLWLMGVLARRYCVTQSLPPVVARVSFLLGLIGLVVATAFSHRHGEIYDSFALTWVRWGDYAQDYAIGCLFLAVLLGAHGLSAQLIYPLSRIARPLRWLSGASFAFYLFHVPVLRMTVALSPWPAEAWQTRLVILVGVPLVLLLVAEVTERRKVFWREVFRRLLPPRTVQP